MKKIAGYKTLVSLVTLLCGWTALAAQTEPTPPITTGAGVDLVSRYIWRGQDYGHTPGIQPTLSATWKGFTLGAWGSYKIAGKGQHETDLFLSKSFGPVTLEFWDYWAFDDEAETSYFDYRRGTTSHLLDASITLSGGDLLPFNLMASYLFYGADPSKSLYLEIQYEHEFNAFDLTAFAGYQAKGEFYAEKKGFVNLGCTVAKTLEVTDRFSIPFSLSLIANPAAQSAWLVAMVSF